MRTYNRVPVHPISAVDVHVFSGEFNQINFV